MTNTADVLKEKGLKVTPQRIAIYTILKNSYNHPTAEDIYKELVVSNPTISLATVYKTLDSFCKVGLVKELHIVNEHSNYDAQMDDHIHMICLNCNKIFDYKSSGFEGLSDEISKECGFDIKSHHITFYGVCKDCKSHEE